VHYPCGHLSWTACSTSQYHLKGPTPTKQVLTLAIVLSATCALKALAEEVHFPIKIQDCVAARSLAIQTDPSLLALGTAKWATL